VTFEDMSEPNGWGEPLLGMITQESAECVHVLALIAVSALAEARRVHIGDPPVGAEVYLGGLACGNLVGG